VSAKSGLRGLAGRFSVSNDAVRGLKNSAYLFSGNAASYVLSLVSVILVARPLGPGRYGVVSTVLAFVGIFSWSNLGGFDKVIIRECSGEESQLSEMMGRLAGLKLVASSLAFVAAIVAAWNLGGYTSTERIGSTIAAVMIISNSLMGILTTACQVHEEMRWMAYAGIVRQVVYITAAALGIFLMSRNPLVVIVASTFSYLVSLAFMYRVARRWARMRIPLRFWRINRSILKAGAIFTFIGFFSFFFTKFDILIIRAFADSAAVGLYAAALTLFSRLGSSANQLGVAFFPQIARRAKRGELTLRDLRRGTLAMIGLGALVAAIGVALAPLLIPLLLGPSFHGSVLPFQILLLSLVLTMAFLPLTLLMQARHFEGALAMIIPVRAALNIVLDIVALTLGMGIVGVAGATVVTSLAHYGLLSLIAKRRGVLGRKSTGGEDGMGQDGSADSLPEQQSPSSIEHMRDGIPL
jgi:O-antigen/teichoic acid export membrane protein